MSVPRVQQIMEKGFDLRDAIAVHRYLTDLTDHGSIDYEADLKAICDAYEARLRFLNGYGWGTAS